MKKIITLLLLMLNTATHAVNASSVTSPADTVKTDSIERDLSLSELVVKTDRIRQRPGGYTINMAGSDLAKGKDMNRMLSTLPGMTIENGGLMIQGQVPAAVYIDGTKITDMDILKNLPPERVASISVDWHAGREETAGTHGGVIRIKTKKDYGVVCSLNATASYFPEYGYSGDNSAAYVSIGTRRMTITNSAAFVHYSPHGEYIEDRTMKDRGTHTITTSDAHGWTRNFYDWLNITYDIAPRHTLGLMGYIAYGDNKKNSRAEINSDDDGPSSIDYNMPAHSLTAQAVAMYNWDIDSKGSNFNVTADYLSRSAYDKINTLTTGGNGDEQTTTTNSNMSSDMVRIRPIWRQVMSNNDELTTGLDYQYISQKDNSNNVMGKVNSRMEGHTPAIFAEYSGRITNKLTYEAGIRVQYDKMTVNVENERNNYSEWSFNPSASLTYELNKKRGHTITLQYEHYTDQLPYGAITTFRNYLEPNHYTTGNPDIKPASGDMGQITLTMFNKFSLYAMYYYDKNSIYFTNDVDPDDDRILRSIPRNAYNEQLFSIGMEQNIKPFKWWTLKATERFGLQSGSTPDWKVSGQTSWIFLIDNYFKFSKTFGGGIYAYIDPKRKTEDEIWGTVWDVSCDVYKTFFNDRLTIDLEAQPYRKGRISTVDNRLYRSRRNNVTKEEYIRLSVKFTLNSGKMKNRKSANSTQTYRKFEKTL